jgi:hypothetical protein
VLGRVELQNPQPFIIASEAFDSLALGVNQDVLGQNLGHGYGEAWQG